MAFAIAAAFAVSAALQRGVLALRLSQGPADAAVGAPGESDGLQRQVMHNHMDVQYYGYIKVGGRRLKALLDTGSFELVVLDRSCQVCGKASVYSRAESPSYRPGALVQRLNYGSGSIDVHEGFENVSVGHYKEVNVTFWDGENADMPVLRYAAFNAIVGVGPPETPGADAWTLVGEDLDVVRKRLDRVGIAAAIANTTYRRMLQEVDLAAELAVRPTFLRANDVTKFSVCLGRASGSTGFFTWNDTIAEEMPGLFMSIKVLGLHSWTVNMTSMWLGSRHKDGFSIGCAEGCGAIVDSGTSLLLMPYDVIDTLRKRLLRSRAHCNNLSSLPHLHFQLDGKDFSLPPSAYIARMTGHVGPMDDRRFQRSGVKQVPLGIGDGRCQLAVMGSDSRTRWGPLWILGMPFFRKYYTIFRLGRNHAERELLISPASSNCTPAEPGGSFWREKGYRRDEDEEGQREELRDINASHVLVPRIAHRAMTHQWLDHL